MSTKSCLLGLVLALGLALPAQADWTVQKNTDLAKQGAYGWSVSVPDTWQQLPDVQPPWPQGAGYASPDGHSFIIISKASRPTESEQKQLLQRGFTKSQRTVKSYQVTEYTANIYKNAERLLYLTTPHGEYRLTITYPPENQATVEQILESFSFINDPKAQPADAWPSATNPEQSYTISYPQDCQIAMQAQGFTISRQGKVLMRGTLHENSEPPAQSFRGMARQLCRQFQPNANPPAKFTPYEIGKVTAYEVIGQRQDNSYYGPLVYVPLNRGKCKVLECYLENQADATDFFKIINTIKVLP